MTTLFLNDSGEGMRMTAGPEPGSAVRHASVVRHVADCAKPPGTVTFETYELTKRTNKTRRGFIRCQGPSQVSTCTLNT